MKPAAFAGGAQVCEASCGFGFVAAYGVENFVEARRLGALGARRRRPAAAEKVDGLEVLIFTPVFAPAASRNMGRKAAVLREKGSARVSRERVLPRVVESLVAWCGVQRDDAGIAHEHLAGCGKESVRGLRGERGT